jgi:hypothetical protein
LHLNLQADSYCHGIKFAAALNRNGLADSVAGAMLIMIGIYEMAF